MRGRMSLILILALLSGCKEKPPRYNEPRIWPEYSVRPGHPEDVRRLLQENGSLFVTYRDQDPEKVTYRLGADGTVEFPLYQHLCPWQGEGKWRIADKNLIIDTKESRSVECRGPISGPERLNRSVHLVLSDIECTFTAVECEGVARVNTGRVMVHGSTQDFDAKPK